MPSLRRPALALVCAGALGLAIPLSAIGGDRASDPVGDGPRPGLDITAVTTTVTDVAIAFEVDLAGDWTYEESSLLYLFMGKTQPDHCGGWFADYTVTIGALGIAEESSFAHAVGLAVDGPHVTLVIPLEVMRDPGTLWFQVMTRDPSIVGDDELARIDMFPDAAPDQDWGTSCREVAVVPDVLSPTPSAAPASGAAGSDSGPWLTPLPVALLVTVAALFLYDWLVAEQRWRPVSRR